MRALVDLAPEEHIVYLGDTGRYPYGSKPLDEVERFAIEIADHLVANFDAKMIVVACNTASAAALKTLESTLDIPVLGVIDPGARAMLRATRSGKVGVVGTVGTISSGTYQRSVAEAIVPLCPDGSEMNVELTCAACPGFVEFVERGELDSDQVHVLAERLLKPLHDAAIDTLLLGCTHYPFLARTIGTVIGSEVVLVSSAEETAFEVREVLRSLGLARRGLGSLRFISSGNVSLFKELGTRLLGMDIVDVEQVVWPDPPASA